MRQLAAAQELREQALALVSSMESGGRPWLWKEPAFAYTLPFWRQICAAPTVLLTLRNPLDSALSYEKFLMPEALRERVRMVAHFLLRWQQFMTWVLTEIRDLEHKMVVSYEALVAAPGEQCARLCRCLDAAYGPRPDAPAADDAGPGAPAPAGETAKVHHMAAAVEARLRRNVSSLALGECAEVSREQRDLYAYLATHLDGDFGDFEPARFALPACGPEYLANMRVFRWLFTNL